LKFDIKKGFETIVIRAFLLIVFIAFGFDPKFVIGRFSFYRHV